jgi:hypothetical protein
MSSFSLRAVVLAMLATLALAANAYADPALTSEAQATLSGEATAAGGSGGPASEPAGAAGTTTETGHEGPGTGQGAGGSPEGGLPGEEHKEAPPPEEHKEAPAPEAEHKEAPAPEEHKEAPPPEEHPESPPTGTVLGEAPETTPVVGQGAEEGLKATHTGQGGSGEGPEGAGAGVSRSSLNGDTAISTAAARTDVAGEPQAALLQAPTSPPTAGGPEAQDSATPAIVAVGARAAMTAARQAGPLGCELAALGARTSDNCTVGWLGGKRVLASILISSPAVSVLAAAAVGFSGERGHGDSAMGNAPISPAPGPAPGGASGASVGGGAPGGVALSIFLTLAGLLLLGGPRAMRRLRLSCEPWLTACFVLIPERPG